MKKIREIGKRLNKPNVLLLSYACEESLAKDDDDDDALYDDYDDDARHERIGKLSVDECIRKLCKPVFLADLEKFKKVEKRFDKQFDEELDIDEGGLMMTDTSSSLAAYDLLENLTDETYRAIKSRNLHTAYYKFLYIIRQFRRHDFWYLDTEDPAMAQAYLTRIYRLWEILKKKKDESLGSDPMSREHIQAYLDNWNRDLESAVDWYEYKLGERDEDASDYDEVEKRAKFPDKAPQKAWYIVSRGFRF